MNVDENLLSREELDAILGNHEVGKDTERRRGDGWRRQPMARCLIAFAAAQSRIVSTLHQRPIDFTLLRMGSQPVADQLAAMTPEDRAFAVDFGKQLGRGCLGFSRSLAFGWLSMGLGAPSALPVIVPERSYTPIETRYLQRVANELLQELARALAPGFPIEPTLGEVLEPDYLAASIAPRLMAASFEVSGLGPPGRLRICLPLAWAEESTEAPQQRRVAWGGVTPAHLMDMSVELSAEIASAELSLERLARLRPGDLIPVQPGPDGTLLVRVQGKPRFRAVRGSAGGTAAIQITGRMP